MAYHVSVHTQNEGGWKRQIYRKTVGADNIVFSYWTVPAYEIGLPLLAQIYHDGLELSSAQFDQLLCELQLLEKHWVESGAGNSDQIVRPGEDGLWLSEYLHAKAGLVREAVRIARESVGLVDIS